MSKVQERDLHYGPATFLPDRHSPRENNPNGLKTKENKMTESHNFPERFRLSLQLESMQLQMMEAVSKYFRETEVDIQKTLSEVCSPQNVDKEIREITERCMKKLIEDEVLMHLKSSINLGHIRDVTRALIDEKFPK
jgi:hypothetical protein